MTKLTTNVVAFTNCIGQVIYPGDAVAIITTGWSNVYTSVGVYLGRRGKSNGVHCRVEKHNMHYRHKTTGDIVQNTYYNDQRIRDRGFPRFTGTGTKYGTPEYESAQVQYKADQESFTQLVEQIKNEYEPFKVPYYTHTTLQLNRIFKIDTSVIK